MQLPVIHVLLNNSFGLPCIVFFPMRIVPEKPAQPQRSGKSHKYRLKNDQQYRINTKPVKNAVIIQRYTNKYPPYSKGNS